MKGGTIILFLVIFLASVVSADIIFTQPLNSVYNLGDTVSVPVTIKTLSNVGGFFQMDLICNGTAINFYRNGVSLTQGNEKSLDSSLVLVKSIIGNNIGICQIKAALNNEQVLSNEFRISNSLNIQFSLNKTEFNPGESIIINGKVTKEYGKDSNGFVEANIMAKGVNQGITQAETADNGNFYINLPLPNSLKAGSYSLEIKAYEKDNDGTITNSKITSQDISVNQVPTNLEIIIVNKNINPGDQLSVKSILHDQTGVEINSASIITLKDSNNKIIEKEEIQAGSSFEYSFSNKEPQAEWKITAESNHILTEDSFSINAKEDVSIVILNKTILITNTGNIKYDKTVLVKIGDTPLNIPVKLNVGESKKYALSAPAGKYQVGVVGGSGISATGIASLTGNAIDIKEISNNSVWLGIFVFLILILGVVAYIVFRKIYKKPFFGKTNMNFRKKDLRETPVLGNNSVTRGSNKAELSLSIKGEKQEASVICLRVKNLKEMKAKRGSSVSESIQKVTDLAEGNKAVTYENQDYLFFMLAPIKTRTFKNERTALDIAESIQRILVEHNKNFNQKIDFGISLNYGTIVAKLENGAFKFMSMGTLITAAKKIAHLSKEEILLSEGINDLLRMQIRTEKSIREGTSVFSIKEIKRENEEARKFIDRFMQRQSK
jgi:hypothetical protein